MSFLPKLYQAKATAVRKVRVIIERFSSIALRETQTNRSASS
jgi:hypothetical protein